MLIRRWQKVPGTALCDSLRGEVWSADTYLLASVVDALNSGNWQRAGKKSAPKPKPVPRPGDKKKHTKLGSDPIPISEFDDWWNEKGADRGRRRRARNSVGPSRSVA